MSDANNFENNIENYSASEEVFDSFENAAVAEDGDFITLSDIVPEGVREPTEMPGDYDDFMYENDSLSQEFQSQLDNIALEQIEQDTETPCADLESNLSQNTSKRRSKRAPKPKANQSRANVNKQLDSEIEGNVAVKRSKRVRKPKVIDSDILLDLASSIDDSTQEKSPKPKKPRKSVKKQTNSNATKANTGIGKKKGRKPKKSEKDIYNFTNQVDLDNDDDADDVCLSKLKENLDSAVSMEIDTDIVTNTTILSDFEYNVDNVITETSNVLVESVEPIPFKLGYEDIHIKPEIAMEDKTLNNHDKDLNSASNQTITPVTESVEMENDMLNAESSRRPVRRKANRKYDIDSDEDPFANDALNDVYENDSPSKRNKSTRYYSDDEYVPEDGAIKENTAEEDNAESDFETELYSPRKQKRKVGRKKSTPAQNSLTPSTKQVTKNKKQKPEVTTLPPDGDGLDDFEQMLESSVIKGDPTLIKSVTNINHKDFEPNKELESFLANKMSGTELQIKKVSTQKPILEIPSIDQNDVKKLIDGSTQTASVNKRSTSVQTSSPYALKIVNNIEFSSDQSEKACDFLKNILSTTTELGKLMTDKADEFMKKKINTTHVKDTNKMDYCVKKAFLLFKLAKDNLSTMEESLEKNYKEFLTSNNLEAAMVTDKIVVPKPLIEDSDCVIVDVQPPPTKTVKQKANTSAAKTVFLNKELSIKIAKKAPVSTKTKLPGTSKKINMKGNNSVWLNSSVMVKKVKPTNHFLAQDGRNKKPPDSVTEEMVSDFFDQYHKAQSKAILAAYTTPDWLCIKTVEIPCNYFVMSGVDGQSTSNSVAQAMVNGTQESTIIKQSDSISNISPESLFLLCLTTCNKLFISKQNGMSNGVNSLLTLCIKTITTKENKYSSESTKAPKESVIFNMDFETEDEMLVAKEVPLLKQLCFNIVNKSIQDTDNDTTSNVTINEVFEWDDIEDQLNSDDDESNFSLNTDTETNYYNADTLKHIAYKTVCRYFSVQSKPQPYIPSYDWDDTFDAASLEDNSINKSLVDYSLNPEDDKTYNVQTLQQILYQKLLSLMFGCKSPIFENKVNVENQKKVIIEMYKAKSLFQICFGLVTKHMGIQAVESLPFIGLTIDTVNTVSNEVYHHFGDMDSDHYADDDYANEEEYHSSEENQLEQNDEDWMAKVQLKELKSGLIADVIGNATSDNCDSIHQSTPLISAIKTEIPDEIEPFGMVPIKSEPVEHVMNDMVQIPDEVVTKAERQEYSEHASNTLRNDVDADSFEYFVRRNKIMQGIDPNSDDADNIFSQSAYRVRRQHDPDSDPENESGMDLLVPHDSAVVNMDTAKGNLMESSSDDEKNTNGKKSDKKKKAKAKKDKQAKVTELAKKNLTTKQKPQPEPVSEISILTRRMREKIRNEENKDISSDSETELYSINEKKLDNPKKSKTNTEIPETEIQCNSVDSTATIIEKKPKKKGKQKKGETKEIVEDAFTGFNNADLNETENYRKQLDDVYEKILNETKHTEEQVLEESSNASERLSPPLVLDEPAEELECEPSMPVFEPKKLREKKTKEVPQVVKSPSETDSAPEITATDKPKPISPIKKKLEEQKKVIERPCQERDGWKCYLIDPNDTKLNDIPYIGLEKLPEEFVATYFRYQEINCISQEDSEVDRLANFQTLHRSGKDLKGKPRLKGKGDKTGTGSSTTTANNSDNDNFDELVPSEDEAGVDDEVPPDVPLKHTENTMAKSSLMDDMESASDGEGGRVMIKKENKENQALKKRTHKVKVVEHPKNLVLTADKMLKKELDLLHAPVNLDCDTPDVAPTTETKPKLNKHGHKYPKRERRKSAGDDSSSEEEKLWVNTKSKLLKRMEKKVQEDASVDDAKRNKIVSEFIDKRNEAVNRKGAAKKKMSRRSRKKMLEREKQMRVLSKESFGDGPSVGKGYSVSYSKGRKNIRKVLDKKSLARSTVLANMEEFERKRRLAFKQSKLREILGYGEDVKVFVINDEVCLEYDFKELQPVVTIHPFFTKVMKAHQYEGVKFMWDACFESLSQISSGSPGGGCILAHCMGLGKTLQVLALLHTVLTHPQVRMRRVLVCCPLSTVLNWVDEIHKWLGPVTNKIKVFELSKLKKTYERAYQLEDWYNGGGIFIVGYELFRSLSTLDPELDDIRPTIVNKIRMALLDPGPDIVVCDEGHLLKNDSSVLAVAMSRVQTKRRIVLTGTPMQNNLREYFCMVNFIKPNLLGTYSEYSNRFENPIMNGQHRDSVEADIRLMKARTHILHKVLEGCLQRQEASVLYPYLPSKHEYTVFITLSDCQRDLYLHYLQHYAKAGNTNAKNNILKDFHILQKIWSHPHVLHSFQTRIRAVAEKKVKEERVEDDLACEDLTATEDVKPVDTEAGWWLQYVDPENKLNQLESSNKFLIVFKILKECVKLGDKLLIFSTSLYTLDSLEFFLKKINKWSLGHEYYRLDGTVPPEVRQKWCREFNAEHNHKTKLFLISTRAGSLGLNLTAANRVIILDTSWNPAHDIQSIFRIYRFGQKKDCYIYRLVAMGTMEQKIYERSVTKQAVACRVVDEQQIDRHYNMADLAELYEYSPHGWGVCGGVCGGARDVVLLRVARHAALHAAHEHDSLLRAARDQDLPEHERAAAWDQFQQEHHHNKMPLGLALTHSVFGPGTTPLPSEYAVASVKAEVPSQPLVNVPSTSGVTVKVETPTKRGRPSKNHSIPDAPVNFDPNTVTVIPPKDLKNAISSDILNRIRKVLQNAELRNSHGIVDPNQVSKILSHMVTNTGVTISTTKTCGPPQRNDNIMENSGKRVTVKKLHVEKKSGTIEPPKSDVNLNLTSDGRYKRRAAVLAEKNLEQTMNDKSDSSDDDYRPDDDYNDCSQDSGEYVPPKFIEKEFKGKRKSEVIPTTNDSESILLSDDDDDPKTPGPSSQGRNAAPLQPLYLDRSLLKNKNFIKIIAHTYLKGNPMLDEDAAMLAAEYSTSKTLKELESTGKELDSGPIFDIACSVLGDDVLRKLMKSNADETEKRTRPFRTRTVIKKEPTVPKSKPSPVSTPKIRIKTESEMRQPPPLPTKVNPQTAATSKPIIKSGPKSRKQQFIRTDIGSDMDGGYLIPLPDNPRPGPVSQEQSNVAVATNNQLPSMRIANIGGNLKVEPVSRARTVPNIINRNLKAYLNMKPPPSVPTNVVPTNVVPVGLFKRTENIGINMEPAEDECILPDDDDVRISSDAIPESIPPQPQTFTPNPILPTQSSSEQTPQIQAPILIRAQALSAANQSPVGKLKRITSLPKNVIPSKLPRNESPAPVPSDTVNLDSDDDEPPPPQIPTAIVTDASNPQYTKAILNGKNCILVSTSAMKTLNFQLPSANLNNAPVQPATLIKSGDKLLINTKPNVAKPQFIRSAFNVPAPCDFNLQPATKPQPIASKPQPTATKPKPTATKPQPTATKPQPTASKPQPTATKPKPTATKPQPTATKPQPTATKPKPTATKPQPTPTATKSFKQNLETTITIEQAQSEVSYNVNVEVSSSSDSESGSDDDPMSVLRNVVHIQAAQTSEITLTPITKPPVSVTKPPVAVNKPPPAPRQRKRANPPPPTPRQSKPANPTPPKPAAPTKPAKDKKKENYKLVGCVDLTDLDSTNTSEHPVLTPKGNRVTRSAATKSTDNNSSNKSPLPGKTYTNSSTKGSGNKASSKTTTITGKSKDIILTPGNKGSAGLSIATPSTSGRYTPNVAEKRKAEPSPSPSQPKKKAPTCLEEFTLDDAELDLELNLDLDIIELE